jgi:hypothetical protein
VDDAAASDPAGKKLRIEFLPDHPHAIQMTNGERPLERLVFVVHFSKENAAQAIARSEFRFQIAPHISKVIPDPPIEEGTELELKTEGRLICLCCGKDHGTLLEWASKLVFDGFLSKNPETVKEFQNVLSQSPIGQAWLTFSTTMDRNKIIRYRGTDSSVSSMSIVVHAVAAKAPIACTHYQLTGAGGDQKLLSHLEATAGGKKFNIIIPYAEGGHPEKIVLKIDSAHAPGPAKDHRPESAERNARHTGK